MSTIRAALPNLGRRSAPQHHAHGRRLCDHCVPAAEDDDQQGREREDHGRGHQGWRGPELRPPNASNALRPCVRIIARDAVSAMVLLPSCSGSGECLTSGDECCTRRLRTTLGKRRTWVVMPAYRLPGLPEDDRYPRRVLPWVERAA